ncbi:14200_t:CDS:2 [Entrophospora sp. SA101]|nr:3489_t:CDS:2 [Entrophospora candida]CAG8601143.1 1648_t:CDS:2 [Entrophospora candida]CAJ0828100.1 14200_t:CDS:2 [Entrophospora sp. SA101]
MATSSTAGDSIDSTGSNNIWAQKAILDKRFQKYLDEITPYPTYRWISTVVILLLFILPFLQPKFDPSLEMDIAESEVEEGPSLPTKADEEFKPFIRILQQKQ